MHFITIHLNTQEHKKGIKAWSVMGISGIMFVKNIMCKKQNKESRIHVLNA